MSDLREARETLAEPARQRLPGQPRWSWPLTETIVGLAVLALFLAAGWYVTSSYFHDRMRRELVAELENISGGTVEIAQFRWQLAHLQFDVNKLTIHGLETAGEQPYISVDHLRARIKILSILQRRIALRELVLDRPVVHIIVGADGRSNHPPFKPLVHGDNAVQKLHDLSLERLEIHDGWLLWNQRRLPLDFSAKDLSLIGVYKAAEHGYDAQVQAGQLMAASGGYAPLAQAQAQLTLQPEGATVKSLAIASQRSRLEVSGKLSDWSNPQASFVYKVEGDAPELTRMAGFTPAAAGRIEAEGNATVSQSSLASSGKMVVKSLTWVAGSLALRELSGGLEYTADSGRIAVPHLFVSLPGGSLSGKAEVVNWRGANTGGPSQAEERGSASFVLRTLPLQQAFAMFFRQASPLKLAGNTSGTVDLNWRGSLGNAEAKLDLNVSPPGQAAPGEIPVTAALRGTYSGRQGLLQIAELTAASHATRLQASGMAGARGSSIRFSLSTSKLEELQPSLERLHLRQPLPAEIKGALSLFGTLSGTAASPELAAHLELRDFSTAMPRIAEEPERRQPAQAASLPARLLGYLRPAPPPAKPASPRIHWDSLQADLVYSPALLSFRHGKLTHGSTEVDVDGTCALTAGELTDSSPLDLRIQLRNAQVSEVQSLAGAATGSPVAGQLEGAFQLRGTRRQPQGNGHIRARNVTAYGQTARSIDADLELKDGQLRAQSLNAVGNLGRVAGSGAYNFSRREFTFALHGANFQLDQIPSLQTRRLRVQGAMAFEAQASGTPDAPVINASLRLRDLYVNDERLGEFRVEVATHGEETTLTASSSFPQGSLAVDGRFQLRGDVPMKLKAVAKDLALDAGLRSFFFSRTRRSRRGRWRTRARRTGQNATGARGRAAGNAGKRLAGRLAGAKCGPASPVSERRRAEGRSVPPGRPAPALLRVAGPG